MVLDFNIGDVLFKFGIRGAIAFAFAHWGVAIIAPQLQASQKYMVLPLYAAVVFLALVLIGAVVRIFTTQPLAAGD